MYRALLLFAGLLWFVLTVSGQSAKDVRQIYSLVGRSVLLDLKKKYPNRDLYVLAESRLGDDFQFRIKRHGYHSEEERLILANLTSISLTPFLKRSSIVLMPSKNYEKLRARSVEEWKAKERARPPTGIRAIEICGSHDMDLFYETYPNSNGIYFFSRIGFGPKRDRATIGVSQYGGCGGNYYSYSLKRIKTRWKILNIMAWGWNA